MVDRANIESVFPLTQMQSGFLWHSLESTPDRSLVHVRCTLDGPLQVDKFEAAWAHIVQAQPVLRSSVHWEKVRQPVQMVLRKVGLPFQFLDWSIDDSYKRRLEQFVADDLQKPLELTEAPLLRITLIKRFDSEHELVWLCHHLLLDGWSCTQLLQSVLETYQSLVSNEDPVQAMTPDFQQYVRWKGGQDTTASKLFWQERLNGMAVVGMWSDSHRSPARSGLLQQQPESFELEISQQEYQSFLGALRAMRISLNSAMQGLWALVIHACSESNDVVFGTTVSGRDIEFEKADSIVGLLINVLPVRVLIERNRGISSWLQEIHARHQSANKHALVEPSDLQMCSGQQGSLFESLLVVENQPQIESSGCLSVRNAHSGIVSSAGTTVIIKPGKQLSFYISTQNGHIDKAEIQSLVLMLQMGVRCLSMDADQQLVGDLMGKMMPIRSRDAFLAPNNDAGNSMALESERYAESKGSAGIRNTTTYTVDKPDATIPDRVLAIWHYVLGIDECGKTESFFDLGGSSIQALRMFDLIERETGVRLPVTTLFQARSVLALSQVVTDSLPNSEVTKTLDTHESVAYSKSETADTSILIEIQSASHTNRIPLFIIDTATDTLMYRFLSSSLGVEQPVYAMAARAIRDQPFDKLAIQLADEIALFMPKGQISLAGMSGGGVLAWQITQVLESRRRRVSSLILLDSFGPEYPEMLPIWSRLLSVCDLFGSQAAKKSLGIFSNCTSRMASNVTNMLSAVRGVGSPTEQGDYLHLAQSNGKPKKPTLFTGVVSRKPNVGRWQRMVKVLNAVCLNRTYSEKIINVLCVLLLKLPVYYKSVDFIIFIRGLQLEHRARFPSIYSQDPDPDNPYDMVAIDNHYAGMYNNLKALETPIFFIKAAERPAGVVDDLHAGWGKLFDDNVSVVTVPGNHLSMLLEERVDNVAAQISPLLGLRDTE